MSGNGKTTKKLRWGATERSKVKEYLTSGKMKAQKMIDSPEYCQKMRAKEKVWRRHPQKNFNSNARRGCEAFLAEEGLIGARRANADNNDNMDLDDDDDDDIDDSSADESVDSSSEKSEFVTLSYMFNLSHTNLVSFLVTS